MRYWTWLIIRYWCMWTLISLRFNFEIAKDFRNGMVISNHRPPPRAINIGSSSANSCSKPYTIKGSMAISLNNTNDSTIRQTAYYHMVITKLEFSSTLAAKCSDPIARKLGCSCTLEESFASAAEFCRTSAFNCCGHWVCSSWLNILCHIVVHNEAVLLHVAHEVQHTYALVEHTHAEQPHMKTSMMVHADTYAVVEHTHAEQPHMKASKIVLPYTHADTVVDHTRAEKPHMKASMRFQLWKSRQASRKFLIQLKSSYC